jgi:hypothetical protein
MSDDSLSHSIFTIEVDGRPVLVFSTKFYSQAEAICSDPRIRKELKGVLLGSQPLCDDAAILRVRLARAEERSKYRDDGARVSREQDLKVVYLVPLDENSSADIKAIALD